MIRVIDGAKGTGKTKMIIRTANEAIEDRKGDIVFLSATSSYRKEIKPQIKFVDVKEQVNGSCDMFLGFLKGVFATNYDIEYVFIDGAAKTMGVEVDSPEMEEFFKLIGNIPNIKFVVTVSCERKRLPSFILKYIG